MKFGWNEDQDQTAKNERHFHANVQWLLVFYDIVLCIAVDVILLVVYRGIETLTWPDIIAQSALFMISILSMRTLWKIYRQVWRYGGIQSYIRLLVADTCAFFIVFILENVLPVQQISFARVLSVSCMSLLGALAMRMVYRYAYKCCHKDTLLGKILNILLKIFGGNRVELEYASSAHKIRIAIVGAGKVGANLAEELLENRQSSYLPKFFLETDKSKIGRQIDGLPVFAENDASPEMFEHYGIQEVVIALPQLTSDEKKKLYERFKLFGCKIKVYDFPIMQQAGDKRHLREFDVEELLFRKSIVVVDDKTNAYYRNKVIMITGGGGSIGSELCRQIAQMNPKQLIILDIYENGAYEVQQELGIAYHNSLDIRVEILSVCNRVALEKVFRAYRPQIVIHAAAHKHVPLMEHNCCEAVENNVFGTLNCVELAEKYRVQRFMMVSTDKAVNPTNVMGATKRMCEMIVQSHSRTSTVTTFSATRFGNVLGSAGSVIPLFKRQIMNGGPITLTDKRIIRYFMTIPEASQLVLQSGAMAQNGELFVLDMGKPVKILDLAESMIRLSGYEPYRDIGIEETGLRPGEKLYEELLVRTEELDKTENNLIFIERDDPIDSRELAEKLSVLSAAVKENDDDAVKGALHRVVPTFRRPEEVNAKAQSAREMCIAVQ